MKNKIISSKPIKKNVVSHIKTLMQQIAKLNPIKSPVAVSNHFIDPNGNIAPITFGQKDTQGINQTSSEIAALFPNLTIKSTQTLAANGIMTTIPTGLKIGVLFSGGPAPGGHNVVNGLLKALGPKNKLFGFLKGPGGLFKGDIFELPAKLVEPYLNTGGFNLLKTDRTKIKTKEQFQKVLEVINQNGLDGIVIIGGDDSNTNAAVLAEKLIEWKKAGLLKKDCKIIGVPKTIDGDLQFGSLLPISFGFHTATEFYAKTVANIMRDSDSGDSKWHFIKLMGRSASHVTLEVALKTQSQVALIGEEIQAKNMSLDDIGLMIAKTIVLRSADFKDHGVVLLPEGIIEFIPEVNALLSSISKILLEKAAEIKSLSLEEQIKYVKKELNEKQLKLLKSFPNSVVEALFAEKDPHGNLQVSKIPTEELIISITKQKIKDIKANPSKYFGNGEGQINISTEDQARFIEKFKLDTQNAFCGYEGRCDKPTNFDAAYTYNLGLTAGSLILGGYTGYMAVVSNLADGGDPVGLPLTALMNMEVRNGKVVPVIRKALVDLNGPAFQYFNNCKDGFALESPFNDDTTEDEGDLPIITSLSEKGHENPDAKFNLGIPRSIPLNTN